MQYEENRDRLKLCALCDARIEKDKTVCQKHMPELELYRNELWFQELCRMQQRQYEIDLEEYRYMRGNSLPSLAQKSTANRGKLSQSNKNAIIKLNKSGLGWRKIAKTLGLKPYTVNKFLYRYNKIGRHLCK